MSSNEYAFLGDAQDNRCALCSKKRLVVSIVVGGQTYGFCPQHDHRGTILKRGQANGWPALRIEGVTGTYALDSDIEAYFLTAICGTDERVAELITALDAHEEAQQIA